MFDNVNLNNLSNYSKEDISKAVSNLADSIERGLDLKVEESSLKILGQRKSEPSLDVLDGLRQISKVAIEKGLDKDLERELKVISNLCKKIITAHPAPHKGA